MAERRTVPQSEEANPGCGEAERVGLGSSFRVFGCGLSTVQAADEGGSIVEEEVVCFFFFNYF